MAQEQGVTIGLRDIYDKVQEVGNAVRSLDNRISRLEEKARNVDEVEKESRLAHQTATKALEEAFELKDSLKWISRLAIGALVTSLITSIVAGLVGLLFFLAKGP